MYITTAKQPKQIYYLVSYTINIVLLIDILPLVLPVEAGFLQPRPSIPMPDAIQIDNPYSQTNNIQPEVQLDNPKGKAKIITQDQYNTNLSQFAANSRDEWLESTIARYNKQQESTPDIQSDQQTTDTDTEIATSWDMDGNLPDVEIKDEQ